MSLAIQVDKVQEVLLSDSKWYVVKDKTFDLDAYEFLRGKDVLLAGGSVEGVPTTGATWKGENGTLFCCPLTAIQAVKYS
ncbi:MAG: hypothetical protein O6840_00810 [Nitrospirae bacterium]|nr:hypothetical protein [Nitrospirota bacterium]